MTELSKLLEDAKWKNRMRLLKSLKRNNQMIELIIVGASLLIGIFLVAMIWGLCIMLERIGY